MKPQTPNEAVALSLASDLVIELRGNMPDGWHALVVLFNEGDEMATASTGSMERIKDVLRDLLSAKPG